MFKEWYRALRVEIKHTLFETWFHFVRFGGLLLIPLIYGFSYVFAFWDPFTKVDQLPIALVTQERKTPDYVNGGTYNSTPDQFGEAIGKVMENTQKAQVGELTLNMKAEHLYRDVTGDGYNLDSHKVDDFEKNEMDKYHVGFVIPMLTNKVDNLIISLLEYQPTTAITGTSTTTSPFTRAYELFKDLEANQIQLINNFKKNYLIAFGIDLGTAMAGTHKMMANVLIQALDQPVYKEHIIKEIEAHFQSHGITKDAKAEYDNLVTGLNKVVQSIGGNDFEFVRTETYMHEHAKYGYGLTPFFVSVAMWVGAMVMTFAVHRRIYDKTVGPVARYFAKWFLIVSGATVQATILMVALYIVGLNKLGVDHWGYMYAFAIFTGIVFGTIVQAIRFIIPSRNIGIFITILILILQMASAGGLFPIETQAKGYQILNNILPMGHVVRVYRELAFETRVGYAFEHIGYLCIYPVLFMAAGLHINKTSTNKLYRDNHWKLPENVHKRKGGA